VRSNVDEYELVVPSSLSAVLSMLAEAPGVYTPIAGGTELMVALAAGRLAARRLVSLAGMRELRFIESDADGVTIGAGTTFTDLRRHAAMAADFPLLAQAASWTGSIANQNRGTLGGNIANASPAADSSPALLVYDAKITLISAAGSRTLAYRDFHLAYKKTALRPEELILSIRLPRAAAGYGYIRKVGTRNAMAISKVVLAGMGRVSGGVVEDLRLAAASLRETPARLYATEAAVLGRRVDAECIAAARAALASEVKPIDDIRSTALYRAAVAGNLLEEFLRGL
jgi:CO/xanthine dehydrogenase FAD-binding subunit